MKKGRFAALWLAALALVFALGSLSGVDAINDDYFTVVNDSILPLDPVNMPFYRDGEYYVPYTVFGDRSLGVYYSYNENYYTLTLYNKGYTLTFDSPAQAAYDREQQYKIKLAANEAGTICVPIGFVCERFGLDFQLIRTHPAYTVRIVSNGSTAEDFRSKRQEELVNMYLAYIAPPSPSVTPSAAPSAAPSSAPVTPSPSPSPTPEPKVVYLTFDDGPNGNTAKILDTLDEYDIKATFFLTGSQIESNRDVVRRMAGEGHSIGVHAWSHKPEEMYVSAETLIDEVERANDALDKVCERRTRLLRFPYGSNYSDGSVSITQDMRDAVISSGYRYWDWTVDALDYEQPTASALAQRVIRGIDGASSTAVVLMHDTEITADALPRILEHITSGNFIVRMVTVGEMPVNFYGDVRTSLYDD